MTACSRQLNDVCHLNQGLTKALQLQGTRQSEAVFCLFRWKFKAQHFDSTMLFKMGKFYEMFEMDAHVGVEVLGLIYMKVCIPIRLQICT